MIPLVTVAATASSIASKLWAEGWIVVAVISTPGVLSPISSPAISGPTPKVVMLQGDYNKLFSIISENKFWLLPLASFSGRNSASATLVVIPRKIFKNRQSR